MGERIVRNDEVVGSSPTSSTKFWLSTVKVTEQYLSPFVKSPQEHLSFFSSSPGMLSPSPLLTLLYGFGQIHNRSYLNRSESILKAWLPGDKLHGMIEVSGFEGLNAAQLFLGFRIGAIRRRDFAVFPVQGQSGLRRLKRYFGDQMSVLVPYFARVDSI